MGFFKTLLKLILTFINDKSYEKNIQNGKDETYQIIHNKICYANNTGKYFNAKKEYRNRIKKVNQKALARKESIQHYIDIM